MTETVTTLAAQSRESVGKGTARELRRKKQVPAVIYGDKKAPVTISLDFNLLARHVGKASFFTSLFDLEIDGKKHRVLPRDVQFDPVSDKPLHVDFLRVSSKTKVRVQVPVHFTGQDKSPGLKRGGTLNIVHHELEVLCSPDQIPEKFEVSLETYQLGVPILLSAVTLPKGVIFTSKEGDYTIASIAVPSAARKALADEASAAPAAAAPAAAGAKAAAPAADAKAAAAKPASKPAAKK